MSKPSTQNSSNSQSGADRPSINQPSTMVKDSGDKPIKK